MSLTWDKNLLHDEMYTSRHPNFTVYLVAREHPEWVAASVDNGLEHTTFESKEAAMKACEIHLVTMRLLGQEVI